MKGVGEAHGTQMLQLLSGHRLPEKVGPQVMLDEEGAGLHMMGG